MMADLKIDKKKEKDLQAALIPAVFHGYSDVVKGAGEALNEYFKKYESPKAKKSKRSAASEEPRLKTTGPQMLDFLVECCYDSKTKTWRREVSLQLNILEWCAVCLRAGLFYLHRYQPSVGQSIRDGHL